jgi:hypothetical protein
VETADKEINFFFPEFNIKKWFELEEESFRDLNNLYFDEKQIEHKLKNKKMN